MPFDNPIVEIPVRHKKEVELLDKVLETIPTPRHWCRGALTSRDGQRFCLIGALRNAVGYEIGTRTFYRVHRRLTDLLPPKYKSVEYYNDEHSHKDVLALVLRAKVSFE